MKICHIANYIPKYHRQSGGAEAACVNMVKFLAREGFENFIISVKPKFFPNEENFKFFYTPISEDFFGYKLSFLKRIFYFDFVSYFSLKKILKKIRPDIVHLHNFDLISLSAVSAAKALKIPVVFSVYDYWVFSEDKGFSFKSSYFRKKIFSHFLKKISAFIVLSENSKKILAVNGIPENKITIVPLLLEKRDLANIDSENIEENSILFAGWGQPRKGLFVLIKAMPEIIKRVPQAKLYVFCLKEDPEYLKLIFEFIKKENLDNFIIWDRDPRKENHKEKFSRFFKKSKIIVVPEQWENMSPVIIAEAMSMGKVIVASRIGGIPDIVQNGISGFLAEYDSPSDFAEKIIKLLEDKNKCEIISKNAFKRYGELFDSDKNVKKIIEVYKSLLRV